MKSTQLLILLAFILNINPTSGQIATTGATSPTATDASSPLTITTPPNTLSPEEAAEGWQLLFDGKTTSGWHTFNKQEVSEGWSVCQGELTFRLLPDQRGRGDLVSDAEFENFDLRLEWKICPGGNSGIFFGVKEGAEYGWASSTGVEMQVLDNEAGADRFDPTHLAGAMYEMIDASQTSRPLPAGEWNRVRILKQDGHVTFWLNDIITAQVDMNSSQWQEMLTRSKWNGADRFNGADFAKFPRGSFALQDHFDQVAYRNIKCKVLD